MILGRKLLRDLRAERAVTLALTAILAVGVSLFVSTAAMQRDLNSAIQSFYQEQQIAHFSVSLKRAPADAVEDVLRMPEVVDARGRVSVSALTHPPEGGRSIRARALSLPLEPKRVVNGTRLVRGAWFSGDGRGQVILDDAYARARQIPLGARIPLQLPDRRHELLVVGTAISPEFVYVIPPGAGLAPDPAQYAIAYMAEPRLQESADMEGAYNEIVGRVRDPREAVLKDVLDRIDRKLGAYGVIDKTPIHRHPSASVVRDELAQLSVSSRVLPAIFLGVAALILSVFQGRRIDKERVTIGTLRALGHSRRTIFGYYVLLGALVFGVGGALGILLAWPLQTSLVAMYRGFFAVPGITAHLYLDLVASGALLAFGFSVLGSIPAARRATQLRPAEAMRPPAPPRGGPIGLERVQIIWRNLASSSRLAVRTIVRRPGRSAIHALAASLSAALIVATLSLTSAADELMDFEFQRVQHQDMQISLRDPVAQEARREIASLAPGALTEPRLDVPVELTNGTATRRVAIIGLSDGAKLLTPRDSSGKPISIPRAGLVLSRKLADLLRAKPGDTVQMRALLGRRETTTAPIIRVVETYLGLSAYADLHYLSRQIGEDAVANGVMVRHGQPAPPPMLSHELDRRPDVIGSSDRQRALNSIDEQFGEMMKSMLSVLVFFSGLIALGAAVTSAVVAVSERQREIGTLRVLGAGPLRVAAPFIKEGLLLGFVGTALGLGGGVLLTRGLAVAYDTEIYRFPARVQPSSFIITVIVMSVVFIIAQLLTLWLVARTDWREALQVKE